MRWRVAALIAVFGIAGIPGISGAAEAVGLPTVHVSVTPASGSSTTHFRVSFNAAQATGAIGGGNIYRITASRSGSAGGKCVSSTAAVAPPALAGATVRVTLAPTAHKRWCVGTFRGEVLSVAFPPCAVGQACVTVVTPVRVVGKFTFHVTRG